MARRAAAVAPARPAPSHPGSRPRPARAPHRAPPAAPRRRDGRARPAIEPRKAPVTRTRRRRAALALGRFVEARTQGLLDRLLRGRLWVGFVGALLAGIVFLNVSLLQLNQDIARTTAHATALDRQNSALRARLSGLDSAERIERLAEQRGMTMLAPGQYRYLVARPWIDSELAARRAGAPQAPGTTAIAAAQVPPPTPPTASAAPPTATSPTASAPAATSPATTTPAATSPAATAPAATAGTP